MKIDKQQIIDLHKRLLDQVGVDPQELLSRF